MTEEEARAACAEIAGERVATLERYVDLLLAANRSQNLIAASTEATIWSRHILDSLQLAAFARDDDRGWLDIGSGAGLPGIVIAALGRWPVTLVETRTKRVAFLREVATALSLDVAIVLGDVRRLPGTFDLITARAVGSVDAVLEMSAAARHGDTRFILPKGRSAVADVESARVRWHGMFHVEHSITDPEAGIVIADRISPR